MRCIDDTTVLLALGLGKLKRLVDSKQGYFTTLAPYLDFDIS
jgi:hypothetical protein